MATILFSTNAHLRTLVNKNIENKCTMIKSFDTFLSIYNLPSKIDLIILDESTSFNKNLILEKLFLLDLTVPIICLFISQNKDIHKFSDKLTLLPKPLNETTLRQTLNSIDSTIRKRSTEPNLFYKKLIGNSDSMNKLREELKIIAKKDNPTLIFGETGVGKELAANILHNESQLKHNDMICVNCSELNTSISDSILFGHEKGSYTGATSMEEGLIQLANDTTLFLDEIENLNILAQAKLLRLVESGEYRRVGAKDIKKSYFRLLTASNCNLEKLIKKNEFRADFYYRISQFSITIPPLREHKEDLNELIQYYLLSKKDERKLENSFLKYLSNYDFPGNIRELNAILERSRTFSFGSTISLYN